jgi:predicted Zn-dependent protease
MSSHPGQSIGYPMKHHFDAASGWLELGNPAEAQAELDHLTFGVLSRPEVQLLRWKVLAALQNWHRALCVSRELVAAEPERATPWICLAFSLVHTHGAEEASRCLTESSGLHPENCRSVPRFLARQTGRLAASPDPNRWLHKWEAMEAQLAEAKLRREDGVPLPAGGGQDTVALGL